MCVGGGSLRLLSCEMGKNALVALQTKFILLLLLLPSTASRSLSTNALSLFQKQFGNGIGLDSRRLVLT